MTRSSWQRRRIEIRRTLLQLLGDLPPRPARLNVHRDSRVDRGAYVLEKFHFDNAAGARVPGVVLLPKSATRHTPAPAILYCHWHGGQYDNGIRALFTRDHTPVAIGPALARAGYVVLAIDAYGFGGRQGRGPGGPGERGAAEELSAAKLNLWEGRTLWGMMLRDDLIALDYLRSRPEVDPRRVGVTGMSMGATRTWWLMALDDRIRAGAAIACLTRYRDLVDARALHKHGIYYFVPGLLRHFDTEAIVSLAAPRPLLCLTGDRDPGSPVSGVRRIGRDVSKVYRLYGQPQHFRNVIYRDAGHEYLPDMWTRTFAWFETYVKGAKS